MRARASLFCLVLVSLACVATADVASWVVSDSSPSSFLTAAAHPEPISPFLASGNGPYPTNQFWTNFVLGDGSAPVVPLPYVVSVTTNGLGVSYPTVDSSQTTVSASSVPELFITAQESLSSHRITAYTELSVHLVLPASNEHSSLAFPLVRGSPYITALCTDLTPVINFAGPVRSINSLARGARLTDSRFLIHLEDEQLWVLYTSQPVNLLFRDAQTAVVLSPFDGVLRIAAVPSQEMLDLLDRHAATYPMSGAVSYSVSDHLADITFSFAAHGDTNSTELLMLALPHHYDTLVSPTIDPTPLPFTVFKCIKGDMREVIGSEWQMREPLPDFDWLAMRAPDPAYVTALKDALRSDTARLSANSTDPYWLGRELASIGRLALIADALGETATAQRCRDFLKAKLGRALNSFASDAILYETKWGGIVSRNSLFSELSDGGLGWYNNHLAAYGSLIFSAAVVNKAEGVDWADALTRSVQNFLVRDLINPSSADASFPVTRHKDWYEGHSWGLGLQHTAQGKSLSSISEAAHAYYAVYLWATANSRTDVSDLASVLCATELRAARRYWQMTSYRTVFDPLFSSNKFVASMSSLSVSSAHGMMLQALAQQARPISPLLASLLYRPFIEDAYPPILNALQRGGDLSPAVQSYAYAALALVEPDQSFANLAALTSFDYAETRTNVLYWAATRLDYKNDTLPHVPNVAPSYSRTFALSVDFAPKSSPAATGYAIDSGDAYTDARQYGWLHGTPVISTRNVSTAWGSHFATFARFNNVLRWKAALPAAGDYHVRVVTLLSDTGKCGKLTVHRSEDNDESLATVGACPQGDQTVAVWSGAVTVPGPALFLSATEDADISFIEITAAEGAYLVIDYREETRKTRDTIGRLPATLTQSLLLSSLSAITAQPAERFYVRWIGGGRASVLVLDSRNYPGAASSADIATTAQRAPLSMWAHVGAPITTVSISAGPTPSTGPEPEEPKSYHVPVAVVVLTAVLGSLFIVGSLIAIVVLLRKRASDANQVQLQEFKVVVHPPSSEPPSRQGSQVDLLQRTASRSSLHTISPTASANAVVEKMEKAENKGDKPGSSTNV